MKPSNFAAARAYLERAVDHLCGSDRTSTEARTALDLLIEAVILAEHRQTPADVVPFKAATPR